MCISVVLIPAILRHVDASKNLVTQLDNITLIMGGKIHNYFRSLDGRFLTCTMEARYKDGRKCQGLFSSDKKIVSGLSY